MRVFNPALCVENNQAYPAISSLASSPFYRYRISTLHQDIPASLLGAYIVAVPICYKLAEPAQWQLGTPADYKSHGVNSGPKSLDEWAHDNCYN